MEEILGHRFQVEMSPSPSSVSGHSVWHVSHVLPKFHPIPPAQEWKVVTRECDLGILQLSV